MVREGATVVFASMSTSKWPTPGRLTITGTSLSWRAMTLPFRPPRTIESPLHDIASVYIGKGFFGAVYFDATLSTGRLTVNAHSPDRVRAGLQAVGFELHSRPSWPDVEYAFPAGTAIEWFPDGPRSVGEGHS